MYEVTEEPFPFWGAQTATKGGRDPLAVQNSSVIIYSDMMPGITNVTVRVRYNGLFCWLLTLIAKKLGTKNIDEIGEQIKYLRRGEYLLSLIMNENYPLETGVSGSIFASKFANYSEINLAEGADYAKGKEMYWKNRMGIFGQYYVGVMQQLNLIYPPNETHRTYRVTDKGMKLYLIIESYVTNEISELFWNSIKTGRVQRNHLKKMTDLALHKVNNKQELDEYRKLLQSPDRKLLSGVEIYHRRNTIKLMLDYIAHHPVKKNILVERFLQDNFSKVVNSFDDLINNQLDCYEEKIAWFIYELNELSHTAYEMYHYGILDKLDNEPQPLERVMNRIRREIEVYKNEIPEGNDIYTIYYNAINRFNNSGEKIFEAGRLIKKLIAVVKPFIEDLYDFAETHDYYTNHPGFGPMLLEKLNMSGYKVEEWRFSEDNLLSAINDHQRSSYSKSVLGQGLVHNYMVEDNMVWKMRGTVHTRTTPRLQNVLLYMEDLKWIQRDGEHYVLTDDGKKLISND